MSEISRVSLEELNAADRKKFVAVLGSIYEHSPWVAEAAAARRPFKSLAALHQSMSDAVLAADASTALSLLNAHPDLAGKAVRAGTLTIDSTAEQQSAGLHCLSEGEFKKFEHLNASYREKFGFPFIICVRRHTKDSVLRQFEVRCGNSPLDERKMALKEVIRIASLRLSEHVSATDKLRVNGKLSTHVLDTCHGCAAQGVSLELHELSNESGSRLVTAGVTNFDGRTEGPLISDRPIPIGRYELRFKIGEYFARERSNLHDPPFLDIVPVRFSVAEPESHYHVPLLATPWSYSTYRGS
jgi:2-oxo-4-hydroxy-4-carboxy-5-ureidoimidazoline decarboxylase